MVTEFMYIMLRDLKLNVREIHSRKPQLYRTRISEEFRDSNRLILVTSDVSTRGVNYPDVTLVIQVILIYVIEESSDDGIYLPEQIHN
jgi:superfamily II DNA/RNA helicase